MGPVDRATVDITACKQLPRILARRVVGCEAVRVARAALFQEILATGDFNAVNYSGSNLLLSLLTV